MHSKDLVSRQRLNEDNSGCLFIYLLLFPEFRIQQYKQQNSRAHNTIYAYMVTKGQYIHVATYIAPIKQKNASDYCTR